MKSRSLFINQSGVRTQSSLAQGNGDTEIGLRPLIFSDNVAPVLSDVEQLQNNDLLVTPVQENGLTIFQFSATNRRRSLNLLSGVFDRCSFDRL